MSDLIEREYLLNIARQEEAYGYVSEQEILNAPNAETTGALDDAIQEYIKDGTLTVQMPTIKEAKAVDKIVVYADIYKQEYYMPLPKVGKWIPCEERMPKAFENPVLVSGYKGYVSLGWWNGKEFETATRLPHIDVKAWQPLPEPYEMERSE